MKLLTKKIIEQLPITSLIRYISLIQNYMYEVFPTMCDMDKQKEWTRLMKHRAFVATALVKQTEVEK